jgi:2-amino-4-hydroxy-6-hydroxymethyldihydropteridine diphosphokinase
LEKPPPNRHVVYIALGTNLGDRLANLKLARDSLAEAGVLVASSPVYQTPPWGIVDQPAFLNQVVQIRTDLPPVKLLKYLKSLESRMGRVPSVKYGPRLIDMDILFYDNRIIERRKLQIPHPRMAERAFVLVPLADLAADLKHPVSGLSVKEMLVQVDASNIRPYSAP